MSETPEESATSHPLPRAGQPDEAMPPKPSSEEIAAAEKMAREFLQKITAVPAGDRKPLTSEKFFGPIA